MGASSERPGEHTLSMIAATPSSLAISVSASEPPTSWTIDSEGSALDALSVTSSASFCRLPTYTVLVVTTRLPRAPSSQGRNTHFP